ncbi:Gag-like protein [Operophtera brumata]|uniref:Gag-like protein n=1 Tax=Operophtera brumata TaxID=104452 RepID=A0A0L7KWB9_OPEBR|nr:Gag-like protein [Operophtera brumata]
MVHELEDAVEDGRLYDIDVDMGTFVRALKETVASIKMATEILSIPLRPYKEEIERLQRDNSRLQAEVDVLRKKMTELRREVLATQVQQEPEFPPPQQTTLEEMGTLEPLLCGNGDGENQEEMMRNIMMQVGTMVNARLGALEGRLLPEKRLRPPLAADRNKKETSIAASQSRRGTDSAPVSSGSYKRQIPESAAPKPLSQVPETTQEAWTKVVRGRGKNKKKMGRNTVAPNTTGKPPAAAKAGTKTAQKSGIDKLRPPRSSAVVITLQPEAAKKGVTYAEVLTEAKEKIALADCGISGLRFRKAVTGARILEVPGALSSTQADTLAQKLRETIGELAMVSRPTKCAELRITGMCDSVTPEEVIAAVAQQGDCPRECVKIGSLRCDSWGHSSIWHALVV